MPDLVAATVFLDTLNHAHSAVSFTMELEENGMLPFLGVQLLLFTNHSFIINHVTLIMAQHAPKRRFLSLIFLVSTFQFDNKIRELELFKIYDMLLQLVTEACLKKSANTSNDNCVIDYFNS